MVDLVKLGELARAATPGPWFRSGVRFRMNLRDWHSINRYDEEKKTDENIATVGYDPRIGLGMVDADFIAAANPATVLDLLAEIERLREALNRQGDNISFILNRVELPTQWYDKFSKELAEDRAARALGEKE